MAMDFGWLGIVIYAYLFLCAGAGVILPLVVAYVVGRSARDPRRAKLGIGAGTVLGWGATAGWVCANWNSPNSDWCITAPLTGAAVACVVALLIAPPPAVSGRPAALAPAPAPDSGRSPDETFRVSLVDQPVFLMPDRNFEVHLEEVARRHTRVVSRLPEAGVPAGSERVVWSADGSRFLVLGRHFSVADPGNLSTGEQAYLMMDVRSGEVWCNSTQPSARPGFGVEEVRAVEWRGWAPAEPSAAADGHLGSDS